ncbi:hypothetical protein CB0940_08764 [Cercospora beticola]|uniref:Uncharacterized protein n=1 Tax=Cercospora beticola TaxID=122368 RepID=A0A2G5HQM1_CERBT|nr:hypothetical protein CB0940_08764 [Cercospora beticola]PIA94834.1 hypothetical protein CB0940_08764 [Cercospora beticola]
MGRICDRLEQSADICLPRLDELQFESICRKHREASGTRKLCAHRDEEPAGRKGIHQEVERRRRKHLKRRGGITLRRSKRADYWRDRVCHKTATAIWSLPALPREPTQVLMDRELSKLRFTRRMMNMLPGRIMVEQKDRTY